MREKFFDPLTPPLLIPVETAIFSNLATAMIKLKEFLLKRHEQPNIVFTALDNINFSFSFCN